MFINPAYTYQKLPEIGLITLCLVSTMLSFDNESSKYCLSIRRIINESMNQAFLERLTRL